MLIPGVNTFNLVLRETPQHGSFSSFYSTHLNGFVERKLGSYHSLRWKHMFPLTLQHRLYVSPLCLIIAFISQPCTHLIHEGHTIDHQLQKSRHWVLFIFVSPAFDRVSGTYSLGGSAGKESAWNAGVLGLIPGLGRSPGEGKGYPLQCSCLKNPMDREAWQATVHRITKSRTWLERFSMQWANSRGVNA